MIHQSPTLSTLPNRASCSNRTAFVDRVGFFMEQEIWKPIPGYEGYYSASNLGNLRSEDRTIMHHGLVPTKYKGKPLHRTLNSRGYLFTSLNKDCKEKIILVHQLIAMTFLNHTPCGYKLVVNHINFDTTDNRVCNLEIVPQRTNANRKHLKHSSQYTGVSFNNEMKIWRADIRINGKTKYLGIFANELDASIAYENEVLLLSNSNNGE